MTKNKRWVIIAGLTFAVALVWAVTSAAGQIRRSTIPQDVERIIAPLNPQVDENLFVKLSQRQK